MTRVYQCWMIFLFCSSVTLLAGCASERGNIRLRRNRHQTFEQHPAQVKHRGTQQAQKEYWDTPSLDNKEQVKKEPVQDNLNNLPATSSVPSKTDSQFLEVAPKANMPQKKHPETSQRTMPEKSAQVFSGSQVQPSLQPIPVDSPEDLELQSTSKSMADNVSQIQENNPGDITQKALSNLAIPNVIKQEIAVDQEKEERKVDSLQHATKQVMEKPKAGHTLPVNDPQNTKKSEKGWARPVQSKAMKDDMPPAPPVDVVPDSSSMLERMWTVGWKKNVKPKPASNTNQSSNTKKADATQSKPQHGNLKLNNPFLSKTQQKSEQTTSIKEEASTYKPRGYFPAAGNFPGNQPEPELSMYPYKLRNQISLADPEFLPGDEFVELSTDPIAQKNLFADKGVQSPAVLPPQKTGFRDFPTWK